VVLEAGVHQRPADIPPKSQLPSPGRVLSETSDGAAARDMIEEKPIVQSRADQAGRLAFEMRRDEASDSMQRNSDLACVLDAKCLPSHAVFRLNVSRQIGEV
jgi:hypothetical protein